MNFFWEAQLADQNYDLLGLVKTIKLCVLFWSMKII